MHDNWNGPFMTVAELMAQLATVDPNLSVLVQGSEWLQSPRRAHVVTRDDLGWRADESTPDQLVLIETDGWPTDAGAV